MAQSVRNGRASKQEQEESLRDCEQIYSCMRASK